MVAQANRKLAEWPRVTSGKPVNRPELLPCFTSIYRDGVKQPSNSLVQPTRKPGASGSTDFVALLGIDDAVKVQRRRLH